MHFTLPIPGSVSVVGFAVFGFAGDGIQAAPAASFGLIQLALFLFGKLFIGNEFIRNDTSFVISAGSIA